jgi:hypothetical protein
MSRAMRQRVLLAWLWALQTLLSVLGPGVGALAPT